MTHFFSEVLTRYKECVYLGEDVRHGGTFTKLPMYGVSRRSINLLASRVLLGFGSASQ